RGNELDALDAEAGFTVRRRDDAAVERELLLLRLQLRFELGQRQLDLGGRFTVDVARRLENGDMALQLVQRPCLLRRLPAQAIDLGAVIEHGIAGLIAAELEHEIRGAEHEGAYDPDQPDAGAS